MASGISRGFEVFAHKLSSLLPRLRRSLLILFFLKSFLKRAAIKPARKDFGESPLFFLGGRGEADIPRRNRESDGFPSAAFFRGRMTFQVHRVLWGQLAKLGDGRIGPEGTPSLGRGRPFSAWRCFGFQQA